MRMMMTDDDGDSLEDDAYQKGGYHIKTNIF